MNINAAKYWIDGIASILLQLKLLKPLKSIGWIFPGKLCFAGKLHWNAIDPLYPGSSFKYRYEMMAAMILSVFEFSPIIVKFSSINLKKKENFIVISKSKL